MSAVRPSARLRSASIGREPTVRSRSSSSATRRSNGVVTLMLFGRGGVDEDPAAAPLDQHRVVAGVRQGVRIRQGVAQRVRSERLRGLHGPEAGAVQRPLDRSPSLACFTVSVTGVAAITPAASSLGGELLHDGVDQAGCDQRPCGVVDDDDLAPAQRQGVGDGLRAMRPARPPRPLPARQRVPAHPAAPRSRSHRSSSRLGRRRATTRASAARPAPRRPSGRRLRVAPRCRRPRSRLMRRG